ncbi:MAG: hypothetical protein IPO01_17170 [Chitinophagaceae bacterium]|nr:hypothetical protein [Chitinophagaceae bacterium]
MLSFFSFSKGPIKKDKIVILLYQEQGLRPVGISKEDFWFSKNDFDTIEIASQKLIKKIEKKYQSFKLTKFEDVNYQVALIRYKNGKISDTIYSDRFFHYWEIGNNVYEDTSKYFQKLLVNFFDEQLQ